MKANSRQPWDDQWMDAQEVKSTLEAAAPSLSLEVVSEGYIYDNEGAVVYDLLRDGLYAARFERDCHGRTATVTVPISPDVSEQSLRHGLSEWTTGCICPA